MKISLIIPVKDDFNDFIKTFKTILMQTLLPDEIIIIDSSTSDNIKKYIETMDKKISIIYKRFNFALPGKARNLGILNSKYDYIAFLDSKTIPNQNWLKDSTHKLKNEGFDVCFGKTKFRYKNFFQKLLRAASYGSILHITTPGTILKKNIFSQNLNFFIENVKAGEDIEWRERLQKSNLKITSLQYEAIVYESLPSNFFSAIKKYFTYSINTAFVDVQKNLKFKYLSILILLIILTMPKFIFYYKYLDNLISNNVKLYLISFSSLIFPYIVLISFWPKIFKSLIFNLLFFICLLYFVYNWNGSIAYWIESSIFYVPHITKLYIFLIFFISIILRGLIFPLKRKINPKFLFPYNWLFVGLIGFSMDVVKVPGYIFGSLIPSIFIKVKGNNLNRKVIFYTKYAIKSASYRYRFLAYKPQLNKYNYQVIDQPLFNDYFFNEKIIKGNLDYFIAAYAYLKRIINIIFLKKPCIAIIHIELLPFFPNLLEIYLKLRNIPFIIDLDDAVYHRFEERRFKIRNYLFKIKFFNMIKLSSAVFCGNNYHLNYFKKYNSKLFYLPTVTNLSIYNNFIQNKKFDTFTIVWIGTPSTTFYLHKVTNVLNKLSAKYNINILIIGSKTEKLKNLNCKFLSWNLSNELYYLSKSHVGIMPLYDTKWEQGKCGFKIIQYMSLKIPVIASPIGVNSEIIEDNVNGMLAITEDDWYNKILLLMNDHKFYKKLSNEGYNTIEKDFSLQKWKSSYIDYINNIYN